MTSDPTQHGGRTQDTRVLMSCTTNREGYR